MCVNIFGIGTGSTTTLQGWTKTTIDEWRKGWGKGLSSAFFFLCISDHRITRDSYWCSLSVISAPLSSEFNLSRKLEVYVHFGLGWFEVSWKAYWWKGLEHQVIRLEFASLKSHGLKPSLDLLPLPSPVSNMSLFPFITNSVWWDVG